MTPTDPSLLEATGLVKHFPSKSGIVRAVDGVDLAIARGETLGLVGESGCGKSTLARLLLQLISIDAGEIAFDGKAISAMAMREFRRRVQIVFQDPYRSLNPRRTIGAAIAEPLLVHGGDDSRTNVASLMREVGLDPELMDRYPHEFSGGQRQRVGIARALALRPELIVLDEPVSALDVSVQAQIVALLKKLQGERGLSYLFISHNLGVVRHLADRVAVMYLGKIVETAPVEAFFANPRHPYSAVLLAAVPEPDPAAPSHAQLSGDAPDPVNVPGGCCFHPRCQLARRVGEGGALPENCRVEIPALRELGAGHIVACHYAERTPERPLSTWAVIFAAAHEQAVRNPNEVLYAIDRDTVQVVFRSEGEPEHVGLPKNVIEINGNLAVVHTHPDGSPPSSEDFGHLVDNDNIRQVIVITPKHRYTFEKPVGWTHKGATGMKSSLRPDGTSIAEALHDNEVDRNAHQQGIKPQDRSKSNAHGVIHSSNANMAKRYKLWYDMEDL